MCGRHGHANPVDARYLENAFQIVVAEEFDFDGAFALVVAEADFGAETFLEPGFQAGDMGIQGADAAFFAPLAGAGRFWSEADQFLGLTDVEGVFRTRVVASCCSSGAASPRMTLAWPTERRPSRK